MNCAGRFPNSCSCRARIRGRVWSAAGCDGNPAELMFFWRQGTEYNAVALCSVPCGACDKRTFPTSRNIIALCGVLQFLIFSTIAMFNYTGGTSWDKSAEGYTFWHNVMSDLGRTVSYSGISNTFSSALFNSSLFIFGMSIVIIYLSMKKRLSLSDNFITFIMIFGIISGLGIIGVSLTPDDILSDEHIIAVWIWILNLTTLYKTYGQFLHASCYNKGIGNVKYF